jgi:hypothetical protein
MNGSPLIGDFLASITSLEVDTHRDGTGAKRATHEKWPIIVGHHDLNNGRGVQVTAHRNDNAIVGGGISQRQLSKVLP